MNQILLIFSHLFSYLFLGSFAYSYILLIKHSLKRLSFIFFILFSLCLSILTPAVFQFNVDSKPLCTLATISFIVSFIYMGTFLWKKSSSPSAFIRTPTFFQDSLKADLRKTLAEKSKSFHRKQEPIQWMYWLGTNALIFIVFNISANFAKKSTNQDKQIIFYQVAVVLGILTALTFFLNLIKSFKRKSSSYMPLECMVTGMGASLFWSLYIFDRRDGDNIYSKLLFINIGLWAIAVICLICIIGGIIVYHKYWTFHHSADTSIYTSSGQERTILKSGKDSIKSIMNTDHNPLLGMNQSNFQRTRASLVKELARKSLDPQEELKE